MVQRRLGLHAAYDRQLRAVYGDDVFEAVIPRAKDFAESVSSRLPITVRKLRSAGAVAVSAIAAEIERRVSRPARFGLIAGARPGARPRCGCPMSTAERLQERFGANISQSLGVRSSVEASPARTDEASPAPAGANPTTGRSRARSLELMDVQNIVSNPRASEKEVRRRRAVAA